MNAAPTPFLTAEWRHLAFLNYEVATEDLIPYVPQGTELDQWQGKSFISMVGFLFRRTRVLGVPIPFHTNFEEVNLRFYVRRETPEGPRRAVVFIKEIVPRRAIAWTARLLYNENYAFARMRHHLTISNGVMRGVRYEWGSRGQTNSLSLDVAGRATELAPGSAEEFLTEHYWGYARQRDGGTVEYRVEHPSWRVWQAREAILRCDAAGLYGERLGLYLRGAPASAFLAAGSPVKVYPGVRI